MTDLRERLRASDPARDARPLDEGELLAMRRAMRESRARRGAPAWKPATALVVVAAGLLAAVLLWPSRQEPPALVVVQPVPVAVPPPPVAAAEVAEMRQPPRKRRPAPPPEPEPASSRVKEIRFVTASGTQILWTVRSSEEGA